MSFYDNFNKNTILNYLVKNYHKKTHVKNLDFFLRRSFFPETKLLNFFLHQISHILGLYGYIVYYIGYIQYMYILEVGL